MFNIQYILIIFINSLNEHLFIPLAYRFNTPYEYQKLEQKWIFEHLVYYNIRSSQAPKRKGKIEG